MIKISRMKVGARLIILMVVITVSVGVGRLIGCLSSGLSPDLHLTVVMGGMLLIGIVVAQITKRVLIKFFPQWAVDAQRYKKYGLEFCRKCGDYYKPCHVCQHST